VLIVAEVELGQLVEVVWVSLLAGVAVTAAFSVVVLGGARSAEARRAGRSGAAMAYAGLACLAFALFAAVVAYGVHVMLTKS
jgi:hypothetical protein